MSGEMIALYGAIGGILLGIVGYFLKRTMNRTDEHDKDINTIKQTYVKQDEVKDLKKELRGETAKLTNDIEEIKANYLTKQDFLTSQARTEKQLDQMMAYLIEKLGGGGGGR